MATLHEAEGIGCTKVTLWLHDQGLKDSVLQALEGAQLTPIPFLLQAAHNSTHAAQAVQANPYGTVSAKGWRQGSRGAAGCRSECQQTVAAVCKHRTGNALQHTGIQLYARAYAFLNKFLPCLSGPGAATLVQSSRRSSDQQRFHVC
jgi:hypothetical protein